MSDLRAVLMAALTDELSGWPVGSGYYQSQVAHDEAREMVEAVIDALLGLSGVAVTQLPEPLRTSMWPLVIGGETEFVTVLADDTEEPIHISGIGGMDVKEARYLAAALLAAAGVFSEGATRDA